MKVYENFWVSFWNDKSKSETDFQATGRGRMDLLGFLYTVRETAQLLKLESSDHLLDIGCGTGIFSLALSPLCSQIVALDISPKVVSRAKGNLSDASNVIVGHGSIRSLPLLEKAFEKVLAYSVLQYLSNELDVSEAFREIARVMRPGAIGLFAANPDPTHRVDYERSIRKLNCDKVAEETIGLINKTLWIERKDLVNLANQSGLEATAIPINSRIQQHTYMYDLLVAKR